MRIRLLALLLLVCITAAFAAVPSSVFFVENLGQWDGDFRFRAAIQGGSAFVTHTGLVLDLRAKDEGGRMKDEGRGQGEHSFPPVDGPRSEISTLSEGARGVDLSVGMCYD